jgi:ABC-type nitrate/sulfonate/bicarbonate transport system permease component
MKAAVARWAPPAIVLVLLIAGWEIFVRAFDVAPYLLPPPSRIWNAFWELDGVLPDHVITTGTEALLGLVFGAVAGALVAAALYVWPFVRRTVMPLLVASQTLPMVVLPPLLVLWFGLGLMPKVLVVTLATFFPVTIATVQGLASADREFVELFRSMGASRRNIARLVLIPSAAGSFFAGLRIAASYAVGAAVIAEWIGASSGLGLLLTRAQASFRVDRLFVGVFLVIAMTLVLYLAVNALAHVLLPWQRSSEYPQIPKESS